MLRIFQGGAAGNDDGGNPAATVVLDRQGNLYGTTTCGQHDCYYGGGVFELTPGADGQWNENILFQFGKPFDGCPCPQLTLDNAGHLYGTSLVYDSGDAHGLADIQSACCCNQLLREVGEDAPVPRFIRIRQRRARHLATESQVIQLALQGTQTGFDVT